MVENTIALCRERVAEHLQIGEDIDSLYPLISEVVLQISRALNKNNKIFLCGNGGSAADAQHLAAEFTGKFKFDRKPLDATALHTNSSSLTAIANDYSYDFVFARELEAHSSPGDILIGISTSGNSRNIVKAIRYAHKNGIVVIALTGAKDSLMGNLADITLRVPSNSTPRIQEFHILIGHIICEIVEKSIFTEREQHD